MITRGVRDKKRNLITLFLHDPYSEPVWGSVNAPVATLMLNYIIMVCFQTYAQLRKKQKLAIIFLYQKRGARTRKVSLKNHFRFLVSLLNIVVSAFAFYFQALENFSRNQL